MFGKGAKLKKTVKIDGMMCTHCEATVNIALREIPQVTDAKANHRKGIAVIKLKEDVEDSVIRNAVEAKGYTVLGVESA